ncbi:hypothetical protein [Parasitella parasitica]|uniref:MICOS complex subunit MIC60 n=1 Tax=Parasitella parasitica TaxID=35722 RepID=A0A0B7NJG5_9FUNG|nr:hypothetical protein [Parasitella parasitica]
MLRASKLCSRNGVVRSKLTHDSRLAGSIILKRLESTAANETVVEKKSGSLLNKLFGLTVVLGTAYGGATYYSLEDPEFRRYFTEYVPGAEETIKFVRDLQKNQDLSKGSTGWKQQVEDYANTARSYGNKIQETTTEAIDYATDAYQALTGQKEALKLPAQSSKAIATETVTVKVNDKPSLIPVPPTTDTTTTAKLTSDKAAQPAIVNVTIEKPEPIIVTPIHSNSNVICELSQIVTELASILNDAGLSALGRTIIKEAETKINQLNSGFEALDAEEAAILKSLKALRAQGDQLEGSLEKYHVEAKQAIHKSQVDTAATIVAREAQLKNQFEQTRAEIKTSFAQQLASDLRAQQKRLEKARADALVEQGQELQRRFVKQVKLLVEQERAGRLAKLDVIDKRFRALQTYAIQNAQQLDASRQNHVIHVTIDALADVLEHPRQQPFADELQALSHNAKQDKVIQTVLSVVPQDVAKQGVNTMSELSSRFASVSDEIRQVALVPEDGGFGSHIISFVMSWLMFKKEGLVKGDDVESVLARTDYYLKRDNLEYATRELNQLSGWPKRLAQDWIQSARRHLEVKQALEVAETQAVLLSLLEV